MALAAPNEAELRELAAALERQGHRAALIVEADAPYSGQALALGVAPGDRRALKKLLSKYPLLR